MKRNRWRRLIIAAALMAIPTWLLFGPLGGFHHMIRFGLFGYMILDGEGLYPSVIGGYGVRFSLAAFGVSVLVWLVALAAVWWLVRVMTPRPLMNDGSPPAAPAGNPPRSPTD